MIMSFINSMIDMEADFMGFIYIVEAENTLCLHAALRKRGRLQYFMAVLDPLDAPCVIRFLLPRGLPSLAQSKDCTGRLNLVVEFGLLAEVESISADEAHN